jgi:hypothetical protein
MAQTTDTISDGEKVLFKDMPISIQIEPGAVIVYQGNFEVPVGGTRVAPGKFLHLACADGRAGTIVIKSTSSWGNQGQRVEFQTEGPFE